MRNGSRYTTWLRALVVEREAVAVVADLDDAARARRVQRATRGVGAARRRHAVRTRDRWDCSAEHVLDVHEQQLLVLLLVVEAELDERGRRRGVARVDELVHRVVDVRAVLRDLVDARPREQTALRARVPRTDRFVVRVEEVRVRGVERRVAGEPGREDERLEEPGGVGPVPLRRAHVGHRLHDLVFGGERRGERLGVVAHAAVVRRASVARSADVASAVTGRAIRNRPRPKRSYGRERSIRRR